ncbi:MAG: hypothetical protein H6742_03905 [Alphaproteobacteria bacterium]|nr:hypothetical protein [Alphaproteobacteria bacterium]
MRLRLLLRKLLTLLLAVSLLPGLAEVVENVEHLLHDGHLPHSEQHESVKHAESHDDGLDEEHGCTPMLHHCGCHTSMLGILTDGSLELRRPPPTAEGRPFGTESTPLSRANAPPTPPPNA